MNIAFWLAVSGTLKECRYRVRAYVAAGVDLPIVYIGGDTAQVSDVLSSRASGRF
jgi:hypothetical protein